ncbi:hypothetical protein SUGI_1165300 [Cryptomeria japonica]|uniref:DNA mismatch repair protein MLH1 n=1 Tax=Cryptomeria japonica TaxID=3369 RepID=UPI0024148889|nr:DNA mismatch repair protein MLH1 [Cryptomeria japonica]GLJ54312.1 hypothetical protein SUGI_1165300 [Cryptomeria japonica]
MEARSMDAEACSVEAPPIRRLEESVVNRIAAGEVIQRPFSAVKELVENSLDASSSSINVYIKDGGLKLIQVSDNGHGIRYEDLPILCERHTTSKLTSYEDLKTISSLGFRGEALASMTFVAHVTVTTITEGQTHGYRASYKDGVLEQEPRPCAAVKGTQIMVENLFYNMAARRKSFKNLSDEYARILDVISRYAIQKINVSFSCKKHGDSTTDVHTTGMGSRIDAIRSIYGPSVARELVEITASDDDISRSIFKMEGLVSSANYSAKKTTMVLFINDRLVECSPLKKAIEVVYSAILPKASKPFIYMSIVLPSEHVDVNIHPTKREVSLLNQESLVDTIQNAVEAKLMHSNTTRIFYTQKTLPGISKVANTEEEESLSQKLETKLPNVPVRKIVRTDSSNPAGRMHAFLQKKPNGGQEAQGDLVTIRHAVRQRRNPKETADLTSIHELMDAVDRNTHSGLLDIVKDCTYVGMADNTSALVQYKTQLYLVNVVKLSRELMYQQVIRRFAHFDALQLSNPPPIFELLLISLDEEERSGLWDESDGPKEQIARLNVELLEKKYEMLKEYFCVGIDQQGNLYNLPLVLDQYTPDMDRLPQFVWTLTNDVDWDTEKGCFESIAAAIGDFYALHPPLLPNPSEEGPKFYQISEGNDHMDQQKETNIDEDLIEEAKIKWDQREWAIQHILFPSLKLFLKPPKEMASDGTFVQVACLENLFKIFERC